MSRLQKFLDDDPTLLREVTAEEFEAVGNTDRLAEWLKECREATPEERESVDKYVESISTPTGVTFDGDYISRQAVFAQLVAGLEVAE